jgi:glycosyltransferase involved in cell wall biosynthesis
MQKVSLYIPCYNAAGYLDSCLEGVLAQTYPIDEILIIDDGSTDKTVDIASKYPVKIIRHKENKGIATTRNTAILSTKNEFVAALDCDCIPETNWLEILMYHLLDETIACVGGRLEDLYKSDLADRWRTYYLRQNLGNKILTEPPLIFGSNSVYRKSVLLDINLYNDKFKTNFEDFDLSKRLLKKGYKLLYDPNALVYHLKKDSIRSVLEANWRWHFYGYQEPVNLINTLKSPFWVFQRVKGYMWRDLKEKRFNFFILDCLLLLYSTYLNFRYYLRGK